LLVLNSCAIEFTGEITKNTALGKARHGRPGMEGPAWKARHGRPGMEGPAWKARHGKQRAGPANAGRLFV